MLVRACILENNTITNIIVVDDSLVDVFNACLCSENADIGDRIVDGLLIKAETLDSNAEVLTDEAIELLIKSIDEQYR